MTTTINAQATTGLLTTADGSGVIKLQSNGVTTNALAWVNFNGGTAAIRASYNVSSITRNGTGDYTINITNALADSNYSVVLTGDQPMPPTYSSLGGMGIKTTGDFNTAPVTMSSSAVRVLAKYPGSVVDFYTVCATIFGN